MSEIIHSEIKEAPADTASSESDASVAVHDEPVNFMVEEPALMVEEPAPVRVIGPGEILRTRREELRQTLEEVARVLKLQPRQVRAMEEEQFATLGSTPHIKGFLRNYGRHLGLAPEIIADLLNKATTPPEVSLRGPDDTGVALPPEGAAEKKSGGWGWVLMPLVLAAAGGALFMFNPGALHLDQWLPLGGSSATNAAAGTSQPVVAPVAAEPVVSGNATATTGAVPESGAVPVAAGSSQTGHAAPVPPLLVVPTTPSLPAPAAGTSSVATPSAAPAAAPAAQAAIAPRTQTGNVGAKRLVLNFQGESWVEIKDGKGAVLLSQKVPGGNTRIVEGQPPFALVIGSAHSVQLQYNDQPVDLAPHTKVDVARLNLN